jgi:serine/threonine-protein kinase
MARDRELQRVVALKEIQPQFAERDDQRARFLLEAEVTGSLEHPGIVPVYSLGHDTDGRPYYAMRFIHGESLAVAIKHFHRHRLAAPEAKRRRQVRAAWGVEFQQLLRRFLDVCDAMEYAHSRGVIHRDLKPGNIMLGPFGETLVVDWGIAKVIGKGHTAAGVDGPGEADVLDPELTLSSTAASGETQPGTTIGTPSYMSPEQARGALEEIGPASDVYSLGATLYELLTGTSPYQGEKALAIIAKVKEGQLTPPRSLLATIPPALEAICLKAMALQPENRYESARELALDLEHWLADEPVAAYPERPVQKLSRWLRRHRAWTQAAAAALVGITMVATIAVFWVEGSRRSEAEARKEAEANFNMAQEAVEQYLTNVSENTLLNFQDSLDIRTLRQELLTTALRYYEKFVSQRSNDPKLRQQLADAHFRVGEITQVIGSSQEALGAFRSALDLWEPLAREAPDDLEFQSRLADCYFAVGKLREAENPTEAINWLRAALRIRQRLVNQRPSQTRFLASLADCNSEIGNCYALLRLTEQGLDYLRKARAIQQTLVGQYPQDLTIKKGLAEIINRLGYIDYRRHDYVAALNTFQEFQKLCREILEEVKFGHKPLRIQDLLARSYFNIAVMYSEQEKYELAVEAYREAGNQWSRLVDLHPSVTGFQVNLGKAYSAMALAQHRAGRDSEAFSLLDESVDIFQRLVKAEPDNLDHRVEMGRIWNIKGYIYDEQRRNELAIEPLQRSLTERRFVLERSQGIDDYKLDLCESLLNMGEQFVDLGRVSDGLRYYHELVRYRRELSTAHPKDREYATALVNALIMIGDIHRQNSDQVAARRSYQDARDILEAILGVAGDDGDLQGQLANVLDREANALDDLHPPERALELQGRAVELSRGLLKTSPDGIMPREYLSQALWDLARLLRSRGRGGDVDRLDGERIALWDRRHANALAIIAAKLASRANLIGYGKTPLSEAGETVRRLEREHAASDLRLAISLGFRDFDKLKPSERDDLKPLLQYREMPDNPFNQGRE